MKRIISILMALALCFAFVSCNDGGGGEQTVSVTVNGVELSEYKIVYEEWDQFAEYCAQNLSLLLEEVTEYKLPVCSDYEPQAEHEILIGDTNRQETVGLQNEALEEDEYIIFAKGGKVVLYGQTYMVGGAANHFVNELILPAKKGAVVVGEDKTPYSYEFKTAENFIYMIGDGMGDNHHKMALQEGSIDEFYPLLMPNKASVTTYSYSVYEGAAATDSAAAGTALATGYKTKNGYLGMDYNKNSVKNIREVAEDKGANTALVTSDDIYGATPAAFYAHGVTRDEMGKILDQLDDCLRHPSFLTADGNITYDLKSCTAEVLEMLSEGGKNFFVMVEEAYIDKNAHSNNKTAVADAVYKFNKAIAYAMEFTLMHPGTVLLVTADHETGGIAVDDGGNYYFTTTSHTNSNVSLYAMGAGTEIFSGGVIDNTDIPKFIASAYGESNFGGTL